MDRRLPLAGHRRRSRTSGAPPVHTPLRGVLWGALKGWLVVTLVFLLGSTGYGLATSFRHATAPAVRVPVEDVVVTGDRLPGGRGGGCDEAEVLVTTPAGRGSYSVCTRSAPAVGERVTVRYRPADGGGADVRAEFQVTTLRSVVRDVRTVSGVLFVVVVPLVLLGYWRDNRRARRYPLP